MDRLMEMRIHGVTAEMPRQFAEAGMKDLAAKDLVAMRIHGVIMGVSRRQTEL